MSERAPVLTGLAWRQLRLLLSLWWRRLRRRSMRIGAAPKQGGVPTFLLINLLALGNLLPSVFLSVRDDVKQDVGFFALHMLGFFAIAFGLGLHAGAGSAYEGVQRADELLQVLPLSLLARVGARIVGAHYTLSIAMVVPVAAARAQHLGFASSLLALALALVSFVLAFLLAQGLIYWARVFELTRAQRYGSHLGVACTLLGSVLSFAPLAQVLSPGPAWPISWWVGADLRPLMMLVLGLMSLPLAYSAVQRAELCGFDRLEAPVRAPRVSTRASSRVALEFRMITRQGAWRQLAILSILMLASVFITGAPVSGKGRVTVLYGLTAFAVYVAAVQVIGQAGIAARRDLRARAFLSVLPLSPYQVLESRTNTLRLVLIPASGLLAFLLSRALQAGEYELSYRVVLSLVALYASVAAAASVAFLSQGVGVLGSEGGETSSSFFTLLLVLPLVAIPLSANAWGATMAMFAVIAIGREAQRAAESSVRWLDDPDEAVERDTGVWRALLVASAFLTMQGFAAFLLGAFGLSSAFKMALGFALASLLLVVLTLRELSPLTRPKLLPARWFFWLLGGAGGFVTAFLSRLFARYVAPDADLSMGSLSFAESVALGIAVVVIAPIAEEYFFRGWLQAAIAHDLPPGKKRWAFALGAVAFAMAHVGSYGVPQLLVGLVAGGLFAGGRGLAPAMIAHAVHNALVSWWPL